MRAGLGLDRQTAACSTPHGHAAPHAAIRRWSLLAVAWPWLFLVLLLVFFEIWARRRLRRHLPPQPLQSAGIAIFGGAPLLLALGQTFVIISGGIDLSVGFIMGLAAVVHGARSCRR